MWSSSKSISFYLPVLPDELNPDPWVTELMLYHWAILTPSLLFTDIIFHLEGNNKPLIIHFEGPVTAKYTRTILNTLGILIAGILPRESSKEGAHGSQSDNRTCSCAVVFTSPLTSRLCSQLQKWQELPIPPLGMWSSSKNDMIFRLIWIFIGLLSFPTVMRRTAVLYTRYCN